MHGDWVGSRVLKVVGLGVGVQLLEIYNDYGKFILWEYFANIGILIYGLVF